MSSSSDTTPKSPSAEVAEEIIGPTKAEAKADAKDAAAKGDKPERHLFTHLFNLAALVVGTIALVFMIRNLGIDNAKDIIARVGPWFPIIVGLDIVATLLDAAAIHAFMRPEARMVSYVRVLAAQASGRSISLLTPGGVIGEATKMTMLVSHAPKSRVVSAIALFDLATLYLSVAILIVGVPLTVTLVDLPRQLELIVWIGLAVMIALVVGIGFVIRRGAAGTVLDIVGKLRFISKERIAKWKDKLGDIDEHLRELHGDRSPGTHLGFALVGVSRIATWLTTGVILYAVGVPITGTLLIGVFSCGVLVTWVSSVIPLGLGIADGANAALYGVLGASGPLGIAATNVDRARSVCVAILGLVAMGVAHLVNRISIARRHRHLDELRERLHAEHAEHAEHADKQHADKPSPHVR